MAAVVAVGASLPSTVVTNAPVAQRLGVDDGWIERRTGIRSRRIAGAGETLAGHAATAATRALDAAGVPASEVDLVLVATTTADAVMPNAAPLVAEAIGARGAGAFDIGAACTGFLAALATGCAQVETGRSRCAVVVGADLMSRITDPDDRTTAAVFADGAGAVVLRPAEGGRRAGIGPIILGSDAAGADHIVAGRDGGRIRMRGHETYRAAVATLAGITEEATAAAGLGLADIDLFVYHQANGRILRAVADRLGLAEERVVDCIAEYGNTSAATLPLALAHAASHGLLAPGRRVLLGAFGAGFTWGATVLTWGLPDG